LAVRQVDPCGDVFIAEAVQGQQDDRGALPESGGCGRGTGKSLRGYPES
jgi:hypothetical protein